MARPVTVDAAAFPAIGRDALGKQPFGVRLGAGFVVLEPGRCQPALDPARF